MMQFDWTTFILEILNFLVLLWILQRLVYRPVLAMLDARQQRIKDETVRAEQLRDEAEALRSQYETRLEDWTKERETSRRQLDEELQQLRNSELDNLRKTLGTETAKLKARNEALTAAHEAELMREAAGEAYGQAAAMLKRLASPVLTQAIVDIFLQDLASLPEAERAAIGKAAASLIEASAVEVSAAHPLDDASRSSISQALSTAAGRELVLRFKDDPDLIAGIRAVVGECQLHANLGDELAFFRRQAKHV